MKLQLIGLALIPLLGGGCISSLVMERARDNFHESAYLLPTAVYQSDQKKQVAIEATLSWTSDGANGKTIYVAFDRRSLEQYLKSGFVPESAFLLQKLESQKTPLVIRGSLSSDFVKAPDRLGLTLTPGTLKAAGRYRPSALADLMALPVTFVADVVTLPIQIKAANALKGVK